jgi:hypothetical protein
LYDYIEDVEEHSKFDFWRNGTWPHQLLLLTVLVLIWLMSFPRQQAKFL